uniref:Mediator of RNA polymerase II transcription subunit 30 n=1 Tax=Culicoides sonorensis TaxID=179676 RepID=A0A336MRM4_CULSO
MNQQGYNPNIPVHQQSPQVAASQQGVNQNATTPTQNVPAAAPAQPAQQRDLNLLTLCRIGQETVQDIVTRFQEVFSILKQVQPPNGTQPGLTSSMDKKLKVQEQFRTIRLLFKRLRLLYEKCSDTQGIEYPHIMSFIPLKDEPDNRPEPIYTEDYKKTLQENKELTEIVSAKNRQLREVIDKLRIIIWEINTMLSMRRS